MPVTPKCRKLRFPSIHNLLAILTPKNVNFAIPRGIAPKISKDLSGILSTPRAKFYADR